MICVSSNIRGISQDLKDTMEDIIHLQIKNDVYDAEEPNTTDIDFAIVSNVWCIEDAAEWRMKFR